MNDEKEFLKLTETGKQFLEESMKYESPITKIYDQIQNEIIKQDEEHLMYSVNQAVGYQVDKDELIKALQYDREQYTKGYKDCKTEMIEKIKQAREEIEEYKKRKLALAIGVEDLEQGKQVALDYVITILDELVESEVEG